MSRAAQSYPTIGRDGNIRRMVMADVQVTCINKQPRQDPHEGITHLGGPGGGGWRWTPQQGIDSINTKVNTFYTMAGGKRAEIGVVQGRQRGISADSRGRVLERQPAGFTRVPDLERGDSDEIGGFLVLRGGSGSAA